MITQKTTIVFFLLLTLIVLPLLVHGQNPAKVNAILANILAVIKDLIVISLTLAIVVFGWGIVKMIAAAGDPRKLADAKGILLWGVIGMFMLASLYGVVNFIQRYTGISGEGGVFEAPTFRGG